MSAPASLRPIKKGRISSFLSHTNPTVSLPNPSRHHLKSRRHGWLRRRLSSRLWSCSWPRPRQSCTLAIACDAIVVPIVGRQDDEGPVLFEFTVVIKGDPHDIQRLPDDFVADDKRPGSLHLREDGCHCCRWIVDMIYDACGKMYLHIGWEKIARYHRLEPGFMLVFSYFGDKDVSVKVFDETCCRRNYHGDNAEEDDD
ncbi:hypothetical protein QYE76_050518 [Lolium multiflorum]|uniref:TF-B3 domain-containing protein n=1 Tax=Lolium multiflorum TaxID=4521 RepID=A0AAD8SR16_LOLMU|nr:hypothetical protein QYE76_050518 [Lolium multiflorum]